MFKRDAAIHQKVTTSYTKHWPTKKKQSNNRLCAWTVGASWYAFLQR